MRELLRFDWKNGRIKLPMVLMKVCTHGADNSLAVRFRGDMGYEIDTFAGIRQEVYTCIQCGNARPAKLLFEQYQTYMLTGEEFWIGRNRVVA